VPNLVSAAGGAAIERLRPTAWSLLQIAIATTASYALATLVLDQDDAVFAPIAAVVSLSVNLGQRGRRAMALVGGVLVGLVVADIVVSVVGVGAFRVGLVALLAASAAVAVSGNSLFVNQAAIGALVVAVAQPAGVLASAARLLDALIGCGVAVLVNLLLPHDPRRTTGRAASEFFEAVHRVLQDVAGSLEANDLERAERALRESRRLETESAVFLDAVNAAEVAARFAPLHRLRDFDVSTSRDTADRIDLLVGGTAALTRGAANLVRHRLATEPEVVAAVSDLAHAVEHVVPHLAGREGPEQLRALALTASERATGSLQRSATLASCMFVGQVRTTTIDLLVITGLDQPEAVAALEDRAGIAGLVRFVGPVPPGEQEGPDGPKGS
jgi:hypothetical protein